MENIKGQGTQTDAVKSLSVPLKMLELSKFREAEVMTEQYLRSHSDEGMAYLILYSAKVKSNVLYRYKKGDNFGCDPKETFPLFIEHRGVLENFLRYGENTAIANTLRYMKAYLTNAMIAWKNEDGMPSSKEDFCDLVWMILNLIHTYNKKEFADLAFAVGKFLLQKGAFDEAKEFFENAKAQGADGAECLYYILFAAMQITDESEFVSCERFSVEMPEYINLLLAIGDNTTLLQKVTNLAEENEKSRSFVVEKREREENERLYQKYTQKGNPALRILSIVLFWMFTAFSVIYFLFYYENGVVWDLFIHLSPFGREDVTGQIRVSLVTSTVILCLEMLFYFISFLAMLAEYPLAKTTRKYVFLTATHLLSSFVVWYVMYGYAHWFENWLGFFTVLITILLSVVLSGILLGLFVWISSDFGDKNLDVPLETFRGRLWTRGYNRNFLAIFYIAFGIFMLNETSLSTVAFLDAIAFLFFALGGAYLLVTSLIYRIRALVMLDHRPELVNNQEKQIMVTTETVTGVTYISMTVALVILFSATGIAWSIHIGLDVTLLLSGIIHAILGTLSKNKMQKSADAISGADD